MMSIIGVAAVIFAGVLIFFPKSRVLFKGFVNLFFDDLAKTPEGAAAIYNEKISKMKKDYVKANDTLQSLAGKVDSASRELKQYQNELNLIETRCERLAEAGKFEDIDLISQERDNILDEIEVRKTLLEELAPRVQEAQLINEKLEAQIKTLERDKSKAVNELKLNKQLKETYDMMDELKSKDYTDEMMNVVKQGVKETRETAVGARVVHENKLSTKLEHAEAEAKKLERSAYAEELRKKYANQNKTTQTRQTVTLNNKG